MRKNKWMFALIRIFQLKEFKLPIQKAKSIECSDSHKMEHFDYFYNLDMIPNLKPIRWVKV